MPIRCVAFDAYGTLCRIGASTSPYRRLLKELQEGGHPLEKRRLMTVSIPLEEFLAEECPGARPDWDRILPEIAAEVASVRPFDDALPVLEAIKGQRLQTALVSNLAPPYAAPLRRLFEPWMDVFILSCEIGAVKPEPAIFSALCSRLGLAPGEVLMVGDSLRCDVQGARRFGMAALHLLRQGGGEEDRERTLPNLEGLLPWLKTQIDNPVQE